MAIRFKLDENIPRDAALLLKDAGHDVHTVLGERLGGGPDASVLQASRAEDRVLITFDLDFADIRTHPPRNHAGIWVLRPVSQSIRNTLAVLQGAIALLRTELPATKLWIVEHGRVRIRE